jgi:hypothetical protein
MAAATAVVVVAAVIMAVAIVAEVMVTISAAGIMAAAISMPDPLTAHFPRIVRSRADHFRRSA